MPFYIRVFFAISCFFRLLFDGRFAAAVEQTKALPPAKGTSDSSKTSSGKNDRHAIPPEESAKQRDTDSMPPPSLVTVRDTIADAEPGNEHDDDAPSSVPPVSAEGAQTGLRDRSPPKPNTVPPPADAETSRIPPTEPSPGTPHPLSDVEDAADRPSDAAPRLTNDDEPAKSLLPEDTIKSLSPIDVNSPPKDEAEPTVDGAAASTAVTGADEAAGEAAEERFDLRARGALLLLALLQREGRFVDFLQQDVTDFDDEQVGAAARVVHEGCRRALRSHLSVVPIRTEAEGDQVVLEEGYDVVSNKLVGNVTGKPPYKGTLQHRGWRAESLKLPSEVGDHDPAVLAQAEVDL
jgi:hypothetical protein